MDEIVHAVDMKVRHMPDDAVLSHAAAHHEGSYVREYAAEIVRLRRIIRTELAISDAARYVPLVEDDVPGVSP